MHFLFSMFVVVTVKHNVFKTTLCYFAQFWGLGGPPGHCSTWCWLGLALHIVPHHSLIVQWFSLRFFTCQQGPKRLKQPVLLRSTQRVSLETHLLHLIGQSKAEGQPRY